MDALITLLVTLLWLGPIVLLIVMVVRTITLSRRVEAIEQHLGLREAARPLSTTPPAGKQAQAPQPPATTTLPKSPARTKGQMELEALIGGRLLNRIGAFALILGVGFFLKYAFDNEWITETMRVLIGIAIGLVCLGGGHRTRKKGFTVFAQGLVGAGTAILYLSLYASFNFYSLIPQWLAFILMSCVTILALLQAITYDSLAVGILGWAGGFLTPFLLSTGESNQVALFTYAALLTLGLLAMTMKRESWYVLEPLTLVALYVVFFGWFDAYFTDADFALTAFYLAVFWILFHGVDILRSLRGLTALREVRTVVQVAHTLVTYSALYVLLWDYDKESLGTGTFVFASLYALSVLLVQYLRFTDDRIESRYLVIASVLLCQGTILEFDGVTLQRLLAVEGFVLITIGLLSNRWSLSGPALGLFGASLIGFLFADGSLVFQPIADFSLLGTPRALTAGVLAAALGASTLLVPRLGRDSHLKLRPVLGITFFLVVFILMTSETNDYFRCRINDLQANAANQPIRDEVSALLNLRQLAISGVWLLYSILTMVVGIMRRATGPRYFAIGLFGLTILKIFIVDLAFLETLYRVASFMALGVILLAVSYAYQRYKQILFPQEQAL